MAISIKRPKRTRLELGGARFGQIALMSVSDLKIVLLAANYRHIGQTVLFLSKVQKMYV